MNLIDFSSSTFRKTYKILVKCRIYYGWRAFFLSSLKQLGGGKLTAAQKKQIKDFYKPYFNVGCITHDFYTVATGNFAVNYMSDPMYYACVDPYFNDWELGKHFDNKCNYRTMFPGCRQPAIVAYKMNGFWYNADGKIITKEEAVSAIHALDKDCFVKLAVNSLGGYGVKYLSKDATPQEIEAALRKMYDDCIVQEGVVQSKVLSAIHESSVNTIRLLTLLRKDGTAKMYSGILRMGMGGAKVDNGSSGGIAVGIEDDGRLKPVAYTIDGKKFHEHPTSHVKFDDFVIPGFEQIKRLVCEQSTYLPHFRLISWDIALDEQDQPVIIEANLYSGGIRFHQLANGPLFGDDTEDILKEVFHNKMKK